MNLQYRINLLVDLGKYILANSHEWQAAKEKASYANGWFTPAFTDLATTTIARHFLQKELLEQWAGHYELPAENIHPKKAGLVMAGNIPLVGFHDFLCVFITGNKAFIKPSSKDDVLIRHLVGKLVEWEPAVSKLVEFTEMLRGSDAYIATGSNNSAGYFEYYFRNYPHIIRRNRTSVAILTGKESIAELEKLADDVYQYFGLGCRNVTKIYVPHEYDFVPLLNTFKKYDHLADHHKYKNNYDYNLAILILNKKFYMSNPSLLLLEDASLFSPISQLNYEFYYDKKNLESELEKNKDIQCLVAGDKVPFGQAQSPTLTDYADGVDTMRFLMGL